MSFNLELLFGEDLFFNIFRHKIFPYFDKSCRLSSSRAGWSRTRELKFSILNCWGNRNGFELELSKSTDIWKWLSKTFILGKLSSSKHENYSVRGMEMKVDKFLFCCVLEIKKHLNFRLQFIVRLEHKKLNNPVCEAATKSKGRK